MVFMIVSLAIPAFAAAENREGVDDGALRHPQSLSSVSTFSEGAGLDLNHRIDALTGEPYWAQSEEQAPRAIRTEPAAKQIERVPVAPVAPSEPVIPSYRADWDAIAMCESSGRWDLNTGNGFWGGLQFTPSTWFAYGGGPFDGVGPFPYSREQQIVVAERVLDGQGPGAWPNCFVWA